MKLQLGINLKHLRRERNITQEELAELLGVSCQSVSRWENGTCYPDLELLPVICSFFNTSVDKLIGANEVFEQEKVRVYLERFQASVSKGDVASCVKIAREGAEEFPCNYVLLNQLMYALFMAGEESDDMARQYDTEIMALGERIMKYCPDQDVRLEALERLAFHHCEMGRKTEGRILYEMLPSIENGRENAMWWCLEEEEKLPFARAQILHGYEVLYRGMYKLALGKMLPDTELIVVFEKMFQLENLIYDEPCIANGYLHAQTHCAMAALYIRLKQKDKALEQLSVATHSAFFYDTRPESSLTHSVLLGEHPWNRKDSDTSDSRPICVIMRDEWLCNPEFDTIRETSAFGYITSQKVGKIEMHSTYEAVAFFIQFCYTIKKLQGVCKYGQRTANESE